MRFGLVGTGPWAHLTHGPGLVEASDADLVGVWAVLRQGCCVGRGARGHGVRRSRRAVRRRRRGRLRSAAGRPGRAGVEGRRAGKHLLLDKPVALTSAAARELADEASAHGCASVVLFTDRFLENGAAWLTEVGEQEWLGASMIWLGALDSPDSPYRESQWRRDRGAVWDIGPHALSTLIGALGPVVAMRAVSGQGDLTHLVTTHSSGASATATMSLFAPEAAAGRMVGHEVRESPSPARPGWRRPGPRARDQVAETCGPMSQSAPGPGATATRGRDCPASPVRPARPSTRPATPARPPR